MPGVTNVVARYEAYGPLIALNLPATFGDEGQLLVIMLATRSRDAPERHSSVQSMPDSATYIRRDSERSST